VFFDNIEKEMNAFIQKQLANLNCVDMCTQPDIQKFLEAQLRELNVVEKSLFEYLEARRRAFLCFHFVSSNDLLDILSKGRNPKDIEQNFGKVFDSLAKVKYTGEKTCNGMVSRENEHVDFEEDITLEGMVEFWLQKLLDTAIRMFIVNLPMRSGRHTISGGVRSGCVVLLPKLG
jgi:dynein heavy chain